MSITNKAVKSAVKNQKVRDGLTLNRAKLSELSNMTVDPAIERALLAVNGKILLTIEGRNSELKIQLEKTPGFSGSVSVEEFLRVFDANRLMDKFFKKKDQAEEINQLHRAVAEFLHTFEIALDDIKPISSSTLGLIKQSYKTALKVQKNCTLMEHVARNNPDDVLGPYLNKVLRLILQVCVRGIVALVVGDKSVSESNAEALHEYEVPVWCYKRFTSELISKDASPYALLFPRKKEKGITCTTVELTSNSFRNANSSILTNSKFLLGFIDDPYFLDHCINLTDRLGDEAQQAIFMKHGWHILPPMEGDPKNFLALKERAVADIVSRPTKGDLKQELNKIGNAILRTSLLENSGLKPVEVICRRFFPSSTTDFRANGGPYQNLINEAGIEDAVNNFFNPTDQKTSDHWAELLCIEIGVTLTNQMRKHIRDVFQIAAEEEDRVTIVPDMTLLNTKEIDEFGVLNRANPILEGSTSYDAVLAIQTKTFSLIKAEEKFESTSKMKQSKNSRLTSESKKIVYETDQKFGSQASNEVGNFLRSFRSIRLQEEASNVIGAAIDHYQNVNRTFEFDEEDFLNQEEF